MATRAPKPDQRQVVNILGNRPEPHGGGALTDGATLKGVEVAEDGTVHIVVKPGRAHCPCCLLDLIDLRKAMLAKRQIKGAVIEVVEVPEAHRWTTSVNE